MLNFLYIAGGISVLLVAVAATYALIRLGRALARLEETLLTADDALREVIPEVRDGLANANEVAAGVNVALRTAGVGAGRLTEAAERSSYRASATLYGVRVAAASLWRTFAGPDPSRGEQPDGR
ncbi:MAG TPA: DUF948 domain-containing protein [Candidatus Dormibacteraeota bacterium]